MPLLPDWTLQQKLSGEKEVLGIFVTGHPLDEYSDKVAELSTHDTETLEGLERGAEVAICGILTGIERKRNKEGKLWAAMRLEDRTGGVEAMVFYHAVRSPAQRLWWRIRRCWCAGWCCPKRTARPRSRCRTSCRWRWRA